MGGRAPLYEPLTTTTTGHSHGLFRPVIHSVDSSELYRGLYADHNVHDRSSDRLTTLGPAGQ